MLGHAAKISARLKKKSGSGGSVSRNRQTRGLMAFGFVSICFSTKTFPVVREQPLDPIGIAGIDVPRRPKLPHGVVAAHGIAGHRSQVL